MTSKARIIDLEKVATSTIVLMVQYSRHNTLDSILNSLPLYSYNTRADKTFVVLIICVNFLYISSPMKIFNEDNFQTGVLYTRGNNSKQMSSSEKLKMLTV